MAHRRHAVLAPVSQGYPPPNDKSLRVTHPSATDTEMPVRLACVKHAASVRSEPGSNSQVHPAPSTKPKPRKAQPNQQHRRINPDLNLTHKPNHNTGIHKTTPPAQRPAAHQQNIHHAAPKHHAKRTPPTYPFHTDTIVKERRNRKRRSGPDGPLSDLPDPRNRAVTGEARNLPEEPSARQAPCSAGDGEIGPAHAPVNRKRHTFRSGNPQPARNAANPPAGRSAISCSKYGIVRRKPSSNGTTGLHPNFDCAIAISGRRCRGSSCGNGRCTTRDCEPVSATTRSASSRIVNSPGLPRFTGPITSVGARHQPYEPVDQVVDIAKRPRLLPFAEHRDVLPRQRLHYEARDHAPVARGWVRGPYVLKIRATLIRRRCCRW